MSTNKNEARVALFQEAARHAFSNHLHSQLETVPSSLGVRASLHVNPPDPYDPKARAYYLSFMLTHEMEAESSYDAIVKAASTMGEDLFLTILKKATAYDNMREALGLKDYHEHEKKA